MIKMHFRRVALACAFGLFGHGLHAQEAGWSLGVVLEHSTSSRALLSKPMSLSSVAIEIALPTVRRDWWGVEYAIGTSVVVARNNQTGTVQPYDGRWVIWNPPPPGTTRGLGLQPIGLHGWAGTHRLRIQGDAATGFLLFDAPLLASNATRFNFTAKLGIGVRLEIHDRGHVVLGYQIHHVSNAGLGEVNPGLDSRQLYLGLWFK